MERKHYYSPAGPVLSRIKQEIVEAISKNPTQDPSVTIEQERDSYIDPYQHLDIVIPLIDMVRSGEITHNPKEGWKSNIPNDSDATSSVT